MSSPLEFAVPGGTIRALSHDTGGDRCVLALHGWLDNAASFTPLAPMLDDSRVVAMDLAGHGHSDHRPPGASYHLVDYVIDAFEVVERLGWEQFTLMGHSLGAGISCLFAAAFPERVEALVLIDGIGPLSGHEDEAANRLRRAIVARGGQARERGPHPSVDSAVAARLRATRMAPASARLIVERNLRAVDGGFAWRTDRRLTHPSPLYLTESQVLAFLAAIECPVLLVHVEDGVIARRPSTRARMDAFAALKVAAVAGQHHVHMDDPAPVAAAVNEFLKACRSQ